MDSTLSVEIVAACKKKLLEMKADLLNRARTARMEFLALEKFTGDEMDQSASQIAEEHFLLNQDRIRHQLFEIDSALGRIANGDYGTCEETLEPIEPERLLAIPYTRLSLEGAEIRDQRAHQRRGS